MLDKSHPYYVLRNKLRKGHSYPISVLHIEQLLEGLSEGFVHMVAFQSGHSDFLFSAFGTTRNTIIVRPVLSTDRKTARAFFVDTALPQAREWLVRREALLKDPLYNWQRESFEVWATGSGFEVRLTAG